MGEQIHQDQFKLLQEFLMKEEKISAFLCEDDTTNIIRVAMALKIGMLEFEEIPGESAIRSGRLPRTVVERCRVLLHPPRHGGRGFPLELSGKPRNVDSSHT